MVTLIGSCAGRAAQWSEISDQGKRVLSLSQVKRLQAMEYCLRSETDEDTLALLRESIREFLNSFDNDLRTYIEKNYFYGLQLEEEKPVTSTGR